MQAQIRAIGPKADSEARVTIEKERELEDRRKTAKVRELEGRVQGLTALRDELIKKNDEYVRKIQDEDRKYRQK